MLLKKMFGFGPPPYAVIGPQEVADKLQSSKAMVIDVREPYEYAQGCIKGSKNIPLGQLSGRLAQLGAKDREIIVVCASGSRSSSAASLLVREGFSNVSNLNGGMMSWQRARLPVKR